MKKGLFGYSGFVGMNLQQFYKFDYFFNSKNYNDAKNLEIDILFFASLPATKWYINKNPEQDLITINTLIEILKTMKIKKIILISTIDIYDTTDSQINEDYLPNFNNNHTYGKHRYIFEQFIIDNFIDYHIIRLPALFGLGLKKNIIYDLLNNNQIENISPYTHFQWYDLNWLKNDIDIVINNNLKICNLFTEPIYTLDITNLFNYSIDLFKNKSELKYNLKTKYSNLFKSNINGYIRNKEKVLNNIKEFIILKKLDKSKLVVSNICIKEISQFQFSNILKLFGIENIQIAPTTIIDNWDNLNNLDLSIFKNNNINIYSFQSITYNLNNLNIFTNTQNLLFNHLKNIIDIGYENKINIIVFGCPQNRKINDNSIDNEILFINFFRNIGDYCIDKNIIICIEPNSKKYNCNYLNLIKEVGNIVNKIDHNNIKMMLDIGNIIMENDELLDIYNYKDIIYNIDISQEKMIDFCNPHELNLKFKNILNDINYNKKINLEMLINNKDNELDILNSSLYNFIKLYGN
jgi:sugar phosphate isomerase/epimerase